MRLISPAEVRQQGQQDALSSEELTQQSLAQRLGVHSSTLGKWKRSAEFPQWSAERDPEGKAWQWDGEAFSVTNK